MTLHYFYDRFPASPSGHGTEEVAADEAVDTLGRYNPGESITFSELSISQNHRLNGANTYWLQMQELSVMLWGRVSSCSPLTFNNVAHKPSPGNFIRLMDSMIIGWFLIHILLVYYYWFERTRGGTRRGCAGWVAWIWHCLCHKNGAIIMDIREIIKKWKKAHDDELGPEIDSLVLGKVSGVWNVILGPILE